MSQPPHARVEVLKGARGCGAKHVSKSKCKKHRIVGTLLDVERLKNCTPFRREAHFEVKAVKTHSVRTRHRAIKGPQACHESQPSTISATPATRNEGRCRQVPRLLGKTTVDVAKCHACHAKCHACHAKCRGVTARPRGPKRATRASPVP